tara:strand:- start:1012 stop:1182 length:171 start_codon:yes stop_codon:yes gene_type:complete
MKPQNIAHVKPTLFGSAIFQYIRHISVRGMFKNVGNNILRKISKKEKKIIVNPMVI